MCVLTFQCNAKKLDHERTAPHPRTVAGQKPAHNGRGGSQLATVNMKYWCEICQHAASTKGRLTIHLNGVRHRKKLECWG